MAEAVVTKPSQRTARAAGARRAKARPAATAQREADATAPQPDPVQLALAQDDVRAIWRGARGTAMAFALAAFPFLFILDRGTSWSVSPVLPGMALLAAVLLVGPFAVAEVAGRLARRREPARRQAKARRFALQARVAVAAAATWVAAWFVLGV